MTYFNLILFKITFKIRKLPIGQRPIYLKKTLNLKKVKINSTGNKFTSSVNDILIGLMFFLQLVSLHLSAPRQVDIETLDVLERSLLKTTVTVIV